VPEAVNANINTVARGVRVMLVNVAAMKLMVMRGTTRDDAVGGIHGRNADTNAWDSIAPFDSMGNITPPGNLPADANAMAANFAVPTCSAANPEGNGEFGFTLASDIIADGIPCGVAENGVHCPSTMAWRLPSPQNIVWG
jgi:hypothetical protein